MWGRITPLAAPNHYSVRLFGLQQSFEWFDLTGALWGVEHGRHFILQVQAT